LRKQGSGTDRVWVDRPCGLLRKNTLLSRGVFVIISEANEGKSTHKYVRGGFDVWWNRNISWWNEKVFGSSRITWGFVIEIAVAQLIVWTIISLISKEARPPWFYAAISLGSSVLFIFSAAIETLSRKD
jgi:hypothetical protein